MGLLGNESEFVTSLFQKDIAYWFSNSSVFKNSGAEGKQAWVQIPAQPLACSRTIFGYIPLSPFVARVLGTRPPPPPHSWPHIEEDSDCA